MNGEAKFNALKWHRAVSSNPVIHNKVYLPMLEWGGLTKPSKERKVVVDLGCGTGELLKLACQLNPNFLCVGIDTRLISLKLAKSNLEAAGINVLTGTAQDLERKLSTVESPGVLLVKATKNQLPIAPGIADVVYGVFTQSIAADIMTPLFPVFKAHGYDLTEEDLEFCQIALPLFNAMYALKVGGKYISSSWSISETGILNRTLKNLSTSYFDMKRNELIPAREIGEIILKGRYIAELAEDVKRTKLFRFELEKTRDSEEIKKNIDTCTQPVYLLEMLTRVFDITGITFDRKSKSYIRSE